MCNEAREKTEKMIETIHEGNVGKVEKPRLDKQKARKEYLKVAKSKKHSSNIIRKTIKKQLSYIRRNFEYIATLIKQGHCELLSTKQKQNLKLLKIV